MPPKVRVPAPAPAVDHLAIAHELADAAGERILPYFRKPVRIDNKDSDGRFDPVTTADRAAERVMRRIIAARLPGHGVVGEEFAEAKGDGRYRWILDPIDGTRAFIMGYPLWGTLIGLLDGDRPALGMMDQPYTRERFWSDGRTTRMRSAGGADKRIKTRACPDLSAAILACTTPDMFSTAHEKAAFARVSARTRLTRFGGDCYAYCLLAAGQIDLVIEAGLKAVDIMPLVPIIEAAGGRVTAWNGGPALAGGQVVAAGDPRTHAAALELLSRR